MADLIASTRQQIEQRLEELRPLAAEAERLERALEALRGLESRPAATALTAAPARAGRPSQAPRRRGAPRGRREGATRANDFLRIVRASGGASIADAAARMGTSPTYLYRIAATLQGEGLVTKRGRVWVAAEARGPVGEDPPPEAVVAAAAEPEALAGPQAADPPPEPAPAPATNEPSAPTESAPHPMNAVDPAPDPAGGPAVPAIEPMPAPANGSGTGEHDPSPTVAPPPAPEDDPDAREEPGDATGWPAAPPSPFAEGR